MAFQPFKIKYLTLLNSGLNKINDLILNNSNSTLTKYEFGDSYNYNPLPSQSTVQGTLVFSDQDSQAINNAQISLLKINFNSLEVSILLNNNIGDFQFGEFIVKFDDGTPFVAGSIDIQFQKIKDSLVSVGNAFLARFTITLINSDNIEITQDINILNSINSVENNTSLPSLIDPSTNVFIVRDLNSEGAVSLAYKDLETNEWRFISQVQGAVLDGHVVIANEDKTTKSSGKFIAQDSNFSESQPISIENQIATKKNIKDYSFSKSGGTIEGDIDFNNSKLIKNLPKTEEEQSPVRYYDFSRKLQNENLITNPSFFFSQRGTTFNTNTTANTLINLFDRWSCYYETNAVASEVISRQQFNFSNSSDLINSSKISHHPISYMRYIRNSSNLSTHVLRFRQIIENILLFKQGNKYKLSFWVRSNVLNNFSVEIKSYGEAVGTSFSTQYNISVLTTNTWERKDIDITIPSSSYPLTSIETSGLNVSLLFNQNSIGATIDLTAFKLEEGEISTNYHEPVFNTELLKCMRYYEKSYDYNVNPGTNTIVGSKRISGRMISTTQMSMNNFQFLCYKRISPSIIAYNENGTINQLVDHKAVARVPTFQNSNLTGFNMLITGTTYNTGRIGFVIGHFVFDSEFPL